VKSLAENEVDRCSANVDFSADAEYRGHQVLRSRLPPLFVGNPKNPIVAMNFATAPGALAAKNFSRICTES
jgi:hypothetical protein